MEDQGQAGRPWACGGKDSGERGYPCLEIPRRSTGHGVRRRLCGGKGDWEGRKGWQDEPVGYPRRVRGRIWSFDKRKRAEAMEVLLSERRSVMGSRDTRGHLTWVRRGLRASTLLRRLLSAVLCWHRQLLLLLKFNQLCFQGLEPGEGVTHRRCHGPWLCLFLVSLSDQA